MVAAAPSVEAELELTILSSGCVFGDGEEAAAKAEAKGKQPAAAPTKSAAPTSPDALVAAADACQRMVAVSEDVQVY